jgi:spore coat protein U-like protein
LSFGASISPGGAAVTVRSSTTISIKCTGATSFALLLDEGTHATGSGLSAIRRLAGAAGSLAYGLFQDGSRTTPWGNGRTVGAGEAVIGDGTVEPIVVYALLSVPAATAAGSYSDSVALIVSF